MSHPYACFEYARVLDEERGNIVPVPEWGQYLLRRKIESPEIQECWDLTGCYPFAVFDDDADIRAGLRRLRSEGFVSAVCVIDPLLNSKISQFDQHFDYIKEFKTHYLWKNDGNPIVFSKHHRYEIRKAKAEVKPIALSDYLAEWCALYRELTIRRRISGMAAFSPSAFERLAKITGLVSFGAFLGETLVACHLWIQNGPHVHSHLAASNDAGRSAGAPYLLYEAAVRHFDDAEAINFGGGAGLADAPNDGLARFKRGFANLEKTAYICGAILDEARYRRLADAHGAENAAYFPAYRAPKTVSGGGMP